MQVGAASCGLVFLMKSYLLVVGAAPYVCTYSTLRDLGVIISVGWERFPRGMSECGDNSGFFFGLFPPCVTLNDGVHSCETQYLGF